MIFAPPMWRKAGRGRRSRLCFIVRLPPQRLLAASRDHKYRRRRQFKFYRAGKGANCLRHRSWQWVALDLMLKRRGLPFDRDGAMASSGKADGAKAHFSRIAAPPPKSLDRNDFLGTAVGSLATEDAAATLTAFTAASIAGVLPLLPSRPSFAIVCGGGARNITLLRELADRLPCPVVLAETFGWSTMEAQAFAYLAARREKNLPITFAMTTGVDQPLEGGVIAEPGIA